MVSQVVIVELIILMILSSAAHPQMSHVDVRSGPTAQMLFLLINTTLTGLVTEQRTQGLSGETGGHMEVASCSHHLYNLSVLDLVEAQLFHVQGQGVSVNTVIDTFPHHQKIGWLCITQTHIYRPMTPQHSHSVT